MELMASIRNYIVLSCSRCFDGEIFVVVFPLVVPLVHPLTHSLGLIIGTLVEWVWSYQL